MAGGGSGDGVLRRHHFGVTPVHRAAQPQGEIAGPDEEAVHPGTAAMASTAATASGVSICTMRNVSASAAAAYPAVPSR